VAQRSAFNDAEPQLGEAAPRGAALRRAIRLSYVAAIVWAVGNALSSGMLLIYLAQELGAQGTAVSFLQSAPALLGLLRLFTPIVITRFHGTKRTCLIWSAVAYALLFAVPTLVAFAQQDEHRRLSLGVLIGLLCVHQLIEQVATVALWTWLADLVPRRIRGRYFARRNMLQLVFIIPTLLLSGEYIDRETAAARVQAPSGAKPLVPKPLVPKPLVPEPYATTIVVGAVLLAASLVPLAAIPAVDSKSHTATSTIPIEQPSWRRLVASLFDPAARRLLLYGCWFSFFNGLFLIAQNILPRGVLGLGLADMNRMQTAMRVGQIGVSAWAGPWSDRRGNRPVLVLCQLLVGAAPLFYFIASPNQPYWLYGAWLLWSAYAGINICLPNLTLRLAPPAERSAHLATYHALTSLCFVVGSLAGGYAFDHFVPRSIALAGGSLTKFQLYFLLAFVLRSAGAAIVASVPEPGAVRWRDLLARSTSRE